MNESGTKIYSISALKEIVNSDGLLQIKDYLTKAPSSVRNIIFDWCSDEEVNNFIEQEEAEARLIEEQTKLLRNPYEEMDFNKRLTIKELFVYRNDTGVCPVHETKLENKQIVVLYNEKKGSQYQIVLPTCKTCKKLFINTGKIEFTQIKFSERNIPFYLFDNSSTADVTENVDNINNEKKQDNELPIVLESKEVEHRQTLSEFLDEWEQELKDAVSD